METTELESETSNICYFLSNNDITEFIFNKTFIPLIEILKQGPKSIEDILLSYPSKRQLDDYNNSQAQYFHLKYNAKQERSIPSESTIYRYLKELMKTGIVYKTKLIDSKTKKLLYGLNGKIFLSSDSFNYTISEEGDQKITNIIINIIGPKLSKPLNRSSIKQFYTEIKNIRETVLKEYFILFEDSKSVNRELKEAYIDFLNLDARYYIYLIKIFFIFSLLISVDKKNRLIDILANENNDSKGDLFKSTISLNIKTESKDQNYEDFISQTPNKMLNFDNKFFLDQISNPKSYIILGLLRSAPRTIKEIHTEFINYCENQAISDPKIKKIRENSLYKNLMDLKMTGLVIEAGRRIYPGKSFTEILYSRSANIYNYDLQLDNQTLTTISRIIGELYQEKHGLRLQSNRLLSIISMIDESIREFGISDKNVKENICDEDFNQILSLNHPEIEFLNDHLSLIEFIFLSDNLKEEINNLMN